MRVHVRTRAAVAALVAACGAAPRAGPPARVFALPQRDVLRSSLTPPTVSVSAGGRFVAFVSYERLARADADDRADIYVVDRTNGAVTLTSERIGAEPIDSDCAHPRISGDGRFVVFDTATARVDGLRAGPQVVLHDRLDGSNRRISIPFDRSTPDGWSSNPVISADGRVIAFTSTATNLLAGADANRMLSDVYVYTVDTGALERVSLTRSNVQAAEGSSFDPSISADGRYVAFTSTADLEESGARRQTLTAGARPVSDVYVRDLRARTTTRVGESGVTANGASMTPAISGDGRYVAFASFAANLVPDDRNRRPDVFLFDRDRRTVTLVSRTSSARPASGTSLAPAISGDGRRVAFHSDASDLVCKRRCHPEDDLNLLPDVFLFERDSGSVTRLSGADDGAWMEESQAPSLDATGEVVAFSSKHPIDEEDVVNDFDLFVRVER